ncbi:collagenase isoform X1 [Amyelois transitella]|uniref:collagenase isoform X1 n=1 Tax=Amyelois transitella TaxID=680683 RepID=UPI002990567A|nr:collagenase isoform X1 [Amyelois transitella]
MRLFLLFGCAFIGFGSGEITIDVNYHENIGIKEAARIKQAEQAIDFDGGKITGGWNAALGDHPHLGGLVIALTSGATSVCGSSLLSNTRAITAAHCWRDTFNQARQFTVVLGSLTLFTGGTRVVTSSVVLHAGYNPNTLHNDVAIINLNWVTYTNFIQPASLPTAFVNNNLAGYRAWAAGFGRYGDNLGIGNNQVMRHVHLTVITNAACAQVYGSTVQANTICTSGNGGVGICGGDSGGPLWFWWNNQRILVGVTSFEHISGCQRGFPGGFARVSSFIAWIQALL